MEYIIVERQRPTDLADQVNAHVKGGWEPLGGVSCMCHDDYYWYCQAMVRYPDDEFGLVR